MKFIRVPNVNETFDRNGVTQIQLLTPNGKDNASITRQSKAIRSAFSEAT